MVALGLFWSAHCLWAGGGCPGGLGDVAVRGLVGAGLPWSVGPVLAPGGGGIGFPVCVGWGWQIPVAGLPLSISVQG